MGRKTTYDRMGCAAAVAVATLSITVLATPAGPLAAQEVIELPAEDRRLDAGFEEIYRLGSLDGGGWDTFGAVGGVGFDGAGNLYILDTWAVRIYVVDLQANLVRQFIGEGEGPGEFGGNYAAALEFAVIRDGRVTVYDTGRLGFALFDAAGEFERTIPLGGEQTHFPLIGGIQAFPGMDRVLATTEVNYLRRTEPSPDDEVPAPSFRYVLSYDLSGDQTRILTRPFQPSPVTDRMKAAEIERRLEGLGDGGGDPMRQRMIEFRRGQIEAMELFHEIPVVLSLKTCQWPLKMSHFWPLKMSHFAG